MSSVTALWNWLDAFCRTGTERIKKLLDAVLGERGHR